MARRSVKGGRFSFCFRVCRFSYLKYLEAVDVEHAHDLVASFSLCLQGDETVKIIKIYYSDDATPSYSKKGKTCLGLHLL